MDPNALFGALVNAGPFGLLCWILLQQRKEDRAERLQYDKDRLATDKALSAAMMALAIMIKGSPIDVD